MTNYVCAYSEHKHTTAREYMNLGPNPRTIPIKTGDLAGCFMTVCEEHYEAYRKGIGSDRPDDLIMTLVLMEKQTP